MGAIAARLGFLLVAAALLAPAVPVHAQASGYDSLGGCQGSWIRQFGLDVLILDCQPGFATQHDRAYQYSRTPVDPNGDWRTQLNTDDAVWLFDAGATGRASLIVDFHHENGAAVADFYDDVGGNGELRYGYERGYPRSVESRFPTVKVTAPDGWWVRGGVVNYNLHIVVDGAVKASFGYERFLDQVRNDGQIDWTIDVHDPKGSGRPKWEVIQATPPVSDEWAILRTLVMVNEADDELVPSTWILWPHLGVAGPDPDSLPKLPEPRPLWDIPGAGFGVVKNYNSTFPPIQIDWAHARVDSIGEFVASRGRPHNWFTYSLYQVGTPGHTVADWENPFAFYDLAGADDGYPDLVIRDADFFIGDHYASENVPGPSNEIRYSWDPKHEHKWSFGLHLYGRRPMPAIVDLGNGTRFTSVPYAEFPRWVVDNPWAAVSMTAIEKPAYWTTEGLYEGCGIGGDTPYYTGQTTDPGSGTLDSSFVGLRCEYVSYSNDVPKLYVSAVDHKVHLVGSELGSWQIDQTEALRYGSLGGPYLSTWEHLSSGTQVQQLISTNGKLLYADRSGVQIANGPSRPDLFEIVPPSDGPSMQAFRRAVDAVTPLGDGTDLKVFFDQFGKAEAVFPGARVWDVRRTADGFAFLLQLAEATDAPAWAANLGPGTYRVSYSDRTGFAAAAARPASLSLAAPRWKGDQPSELTPTRLTVTVRNNGDESLTAVPILFTVARKGAPGQTVASTIVDVPADRAVEAEAIWPATAAGDWEIRAVAPGTDAVSSDATTVRIAPAPPTDLSAILVAQGLRPFAGSAITASVTLLIALAVGIGLVVWRVPRPDDRAA